MGLIEMRVFDETRIASAFGVPPFLVGLPSPDGLTYSNANGLFEYHWRATLRTMAVAVAGAISGWALPRGTRMEFNRDPYVQASPKERAETYAILFGMVDEKGNRAITVDEIRMAERHLPNEPTEDLAAQAEGTISS
jgi:phage portal protein BeeE